MIALSRCRLVSQAYSRLPGVASERGKGSAGGGLAVDLVPVAFASLALLEEGPYEGVHNVRLVLLQPVTGPRDDVEAEMIPDVEAARLRHFLLQEGVPLTPQQQHRRPDVILAQGQGAEKRRESLSAAKWCSVRDSQCHAPMEHLNRTEPPFMLTPVQPTCPLWTKGTFCVRSYSYTVCSYVSMKVLHQFSANFGNFDKIKHEPVSRCTKTSK